MSHALLQFRPLNVEPRAKGCVHRPWRRWRTLGVWTFFILLRVVHFLLCASQLARWGLPDYVGVGIPVSSVQTRPEYHTNDVCAPEKSNLSTWSIGAVALVAQAHTCTWAYTRTHTPVHAPQTCARNWNGRYQRVYFCSTLHKMALIHANVWR